MAMLLVIFPMFSFPKKLPPRQKKKKKKKKSNSYDVSSDDDVMKEKSSNKMKADTGAGPAIGFGKNFRGTIT